MDAAQHPRKTQASLLTSSPGHPSESGNTTPLPPVTAQATTSDDGIDWTTIGLGVAGTLLALGGIAAVTIRKPASRARASAPDRNRRTGAPARWAGAPRSFLYAQTAIETRGAAEAG